MNAQLIFDTIVTHLRNQGCKSTDRFQTACSYRGEDGAKCAAGCLIPDHLYSPELEGHMWSSLQLKECREYVGEEHTALIGTLQNVHDRTSVTQWETRFRQVAEDFNLDYTPPAV